MERLAYRPAEVAEKIGVDKQTVTNWLNKGLLFGTKIEGGWFINIQEVKRILSIKDNRPVLTDMNAEYRKWFSELNEKDKLQELDRLLHS